jgi:ribonuclease J
LSGTLRVLPLGGVGEIGKNMTVVEYDGRIVVVDTGLRFPTAEQMGIDLVLPDFAYLRERVDDIEAIVITHGHEDHLGSLPWLLRELGETSIPVTYGGQLTVAMARSKLDEHKLREARLDVLPTGEVADAGPFTIEMIHLTHSIPDACGVALTTELGTVLFTGDYKFDQTPVGGAPADVSRLAELGREGLLLLCGDSTNADRPGFSTSESVVGPNLERVFQRCPGRIVVTCFASNIHRVQQVVDAAAQLDRKVALVGRSMRKNINIGRSLGHINVPEGMLIPLRPRYVMPVHGDFKRMLLHSKLAQAVGVPLESIFRTENGQPLEIDAHGARLGERVQSGMIFVDGVDIGDVADVALRDRRMLSADGIFIIVATVSEQDGSSVVPPEVLARGVPFLEGNSEFVDELREAVEDSLDRAAEQRVTEIEVLESMLHDDLAGFIYERLRRRPMVLPVVVEV